MAEIEWISIPDYAKRLGITVPTIRRQIDSGKITEKALKPKKPGGKQLLINPAQADKDRAANLGQQRKSAPVEQPQKEPTTEEKRTQTIQAAGLQNATRADAETWQAKFKAALLKIELEERQGKLLKKDDVEKEAFETARRVRDAILNIPDRISAELASMTDTHLINDKLVTEITQALEELSA